MKKRKYLVLVSPRDNPHDAAAVPCEAILPEVAWQGYTNEPAESVKVSPGVWFMVGEEDCGWVLEVKTTPKEVRGIARRWNRQQDVGDEEVDQVMKWVARA